jgi:hypothetical protein
MYLTALSPSYNFDTELAARNKEKNGLFFAMKKRHYHSLRSVG